MADKLDALLERVSDVGLRSELRGQIERLRQLRQFGLVYGSHLSERERLPDHVEELSLLHIHDRGTPLPPPPAALAAEQCLIKAQRLHSARLVGVGVQQRLAPRHHSPHPPPTHSPLRTEEP